MAELVTQNLQRDTVLQSERHGRGERVHEPGDRRSFLRHSDEHLSGSTVFVKTYRDVALLPPDRKVMSQTVPLVRKASSDCRITAVVLGGFTRAVCIAIGNFRARLCKGLLGINNGSLASSRHIVLR